MTKANECTCPSGDGSLRHPCPAHPAAEQAGGDERAAFEYWASDEGLYPKAVERAGNCYKLAQTQSYWMAWQARAALAQPSPVSEALIYACKNLAQITSSDGSGHADIAMAVLRMAGVGDDERERLVNEWKAARAWKPSPAQAEGAPVVGCLCGMPMTEGHHSPDGCCNLEEFAPNTAQSQAEGFTHFPELLESVQQMDAMLKAEAERPEVVAYFDRNYPSTGDAFIWSNYEGSPYEPVMTVAQHERIVGALRTKTACTMGVGGGDGQLFVHGDHASIKAAQKIVLERDAALARVAKLEKQEPVALANRGIHAFWVKWTEAAAGLYGPGIKLYAHPVAQAQHSVPEASEQEKEQGWTLDYSFVERVTDLAASRTEYTTSMEATEQVLLAARELLAAAPGNSVPQAWLDVQAERRRQVEAEGWTPEHDDAHSPGEMARAAACYALAGSSAPNDGTAALLVSLAWPWDEQWWKPTTTRRDLVKACALGLAEIERLDRAAAPGKEVGHE